MRILSLCSILLGFACGSTVLAEPTDYGGVLAIDSVQADPGDHPVLNVRLSNNDINVSGMTFPIKWDSEYLSFDSVSIDGTVFGSEFAGYSSDDLADGKVQITILPAEIEPPMPFVTFDDGIVARLFFAVSAGAPAEQIAIDSIYTDTVLAGGIHVTVQVGVSDPTGGDVFQPEFVPGEIEVRSGTAVWDDDATGLPTAFALEQNYPNPFNPSTVIKFSLPEPGPVHLDVFNVLGQEVERLVDERLPAGDHEAEFSSGNLPSGIYFYRLTSGGQSQTRKMILLK